MIQLIDLDIPPLRYTKFISAWLYKGEGGNFLVDPGPACTIPVLLDELSRHGVTKLDLILLTHIHMDHAGGIGDLAEKFPDARVVCHGKAVRHLIDPIKLWKGSLKVLGKVAKTYGPIKAIPGSNITTADHIDFEEGIKVIPAPGHAVHHQCFVFKNWLFCGELFGIMLDIDGDIYMRPATPPRVDLKAWLESIDLIKPEANRNICFSHYGMYPDGMTIFKMAKEQIKLWEKVIKKHIGNPDKKAIVADLMKQDPVYARMQDLPLQLLNREMFFSENAVSGILQYLYDR